MHKKIPYSVFSYALIMLSLALAGCDRTDLSGRIERKLNSEKEGEMPLVKFPPELTGFYSERDFEALWFDGGRLSSPGEELLTVLSACRFDGLAPADYHLDRIYELAGEDQPNKSRLNARKLSEDQKAEMELLLSDGFLRLVHDLTEGKLDLPSLDPSWKFERRESGLSPVDFLAQISTGKRVEAMMEDLVPQQDLYRNSRKALQSLYEDLEGDSLDWREIGFKESPELGDRDPGISALRKRLAFWGYIENSGSSDPDVFDGELEKALKAYQVANGMEPDGKLGPLTLKIGRAHV